MIKKNKDSKTRQAVDRKSIPKSMQNTPHPNGFQCFHLPPRVFQAIVDFLLTAMEPHHMVAHSMRSPTE